MSMEIHTLKVLAKGWCYDTRQNLYRIKALDTLIDAGLAEIKDEFMECWGGKTWNVREIGLTEKGEERVMMMGKGH